MTLRLILFVGIFFFSPLFSKSSSAVLYEPRGDGCGRTGDKLTLYVKAKWISYKYNIPLYYQWFKYADELQLSSIEKKWQPKEANKYRNKQKLHLKLKAPLDNIIKPHDAVLYQVSYRMHPINWLERHEICTWENLIRDKDFLEELRRCIKPKKPLSFVEVPVDKIALAVHVRKGGGADYPLLSTQEYENIFVEKSTATHHSIKEKYADCRWPTKFPPDQYYINQIRWLSNWLGDPPMYCFIFTDDQNPILIMQSYEKAVGKSNITFDCRKKENGPKIHVLEDMFSMAQFDYLIRSASNYAQIAQLIGKHRMVIYPKHGLWRGNTLVITEGIWESR